MKSQSIVLAKAVAARDKDSSGYATFVFEPLETLKGKPPAKLERYGMIVGGHAARQHGLLGSDYEDHKSADFWAWVNGNGAIMPSCGLYGAFEVGETYLLFIRDEQHSLAQERISTKDDLWLAVIRTVAENYGDGILEEFFEAPESSNMSDCVEKVVNDPELLYVRHFMIESCMNRHASKEADTRQ